MDAEHYPVGTVATMARVTVRTLHHYDHTGLLRPSGRTASGYRTYSAADLERLQRILCYRQLGMPLTEIRAIVDTPGANRLEQLRRQHGLLADRVRELEQMLAAVEKMMEADRMGLRLDPHEVVEAFGDKDPAAFAAEAEQRWGTTAPWAESRRRTAAYTKADWTRNRAEFEAICQRLATANAAGVRPTSPEAMAVAEAHRQHIDRWWYPCSRTMHRGLADLYVADSRFANTFDRLAPGLSAYAHDAIHANAGGRPDD